MVAIATETLKNGKYVVFMFLFSHLSKGVGDKIINNFYYNIEIDFFVRIQIIIVSFI